MNAIDISLVDKEDVRHMNEAQLGSLGVRMFNGRDLVLQCVTCGETWELQLAANGKLPFHYWVCPGKCNQR